MRQIMLGKTGAEVSAISLGTWSYGGANKQGEIPVGWEGQQYVVMKLVSIIGIRQMFMVMVDQNR